MSSGVVLVLAPAGIAALAAAVVLVMRHRRRPPDGNGGKVEWDTHDPDRGPWS